MLTTIEERIDWVERQEGGLRDWVALSFLGPPLRNQKTLVC